MSKPTYAERIGMPYIEHLQSIQFNFWEWKESDTATDRFNAAVARIIAEETAKIRAERDKLIAAWPDVEQNAVSGLWYTAVEIELGIDGFSSREAAVRAAAGLDTTP